MATRSKKARRAAAHARRLDAVRDYAAALRELFRPETAGAAWVAADVRGRNARNRLTAMYGHRAVRLMSAIYRRTIRSAPRA